MKGQANSSEKPRQIIHVDMDAFYAAIEQRDRPELRGKPVIVGGGERRGVVSTASYETRAYGVGSAMPTAEAMRRCPHAILVTPRHAHYAAVSRAVFAIFQRYTPLIEGLSLDEAFLDVSACGKLFGDAPRIAALIRADIHNELQLTASAGVAPNKFLAKIASEMDKPNGLTIVPETVAEFLAPLAIERMWGVGPVAARKLRSFGFRTFGDLARRPAKELVAQLGDWGAHLHDLSRGVDHRQVESERPSKSVSAEETFAHDIHDYTELKRRLLGQAERVASRLVAANLRGRCVTLKIKFADFSLKTRSQTLAQSVSDSPSIYHAAVKLLDKLPLGNKGVRLSGVGISQFGVSQNELFVDSDIKRGNTLEAVKARIREKYGQGSVAPATLLERSKNGGPD